MNLAYSSSRVFTDSSTRAWIVTALGCFGGDFNIDNGLLLSFSCKLSHFLSDKFSGLCLQARKTRLRSTCEGGSDPDRTFGRIDCQKVGSLPPNLVFLSVSLFSSSCCLFLSFAETYAHPKVKKMVKTK